MRDKENLVRWKLENRERINAYNREYSKKNREKRKKIEESWKQRNPDKVKLHNKKAGAKWAKNNKGLKNFSTNLRRTALKQRTPIWADLDVIRMYYILADGLSRLTGIPHEVDHIIPLQGEFISGLHVPENLQVITREENRRKKNHCVV